MGCTLARHARFWGPLHKRDNQPMHYLMPNLYAPLRCVQGNALASLPPMLGFASLQRLNLSSNCLASPAPTAAALAPLALLSSLHLSGNPLAAGPAYPAAMHAALPWLHELDGEVVAEAERRERLVAAARRGQLPLASWQCPSWRPPGLEQLSQCAAGALAAQQQQQHEAACQTSGASSGWVAPQLLWALSSAAVPATAAASATAALQPSEAAASSNSGLAGLASLAVVPVGALAAPPPGEPSAEQLQRQYALLLTGGLPAAGGLLVVNSGYFSEVLAALSRPAVAIQSAWRGCAARQLCRRLAAERVAQQVGAAGRPSDRCKGQGSAY